MESYSPNYIKITKLIYGLLCFGQHGTSENSLIGRIVV